MGLIPAPSIKRPTNDSVELEKMNQIIMWNKLSKAKRKKLTKEALESIHKWGNK